MRRRLSASMGQTLTDGRAYRVWSWPNLSRMLPRSRQAERLLPPG